MKKIIVASFVIFALAACGGNDSKDSKDVKKEETKDNSSEGSELSSNPDYQKGLAIVAKNDCFTCHAISEAKVGPTYIDVANKYADGGDRIDNFLSDKVRMGWKGICRQTAYTATSK